VVDAYGGALLYEFERYGAANACCAAGDGAYLSSEETCHGYGVLVLLLEERSSMMAAIVECEERWICLFDPQTIERKQVK
jgi:hypothetical protein